MQIAASCRPSGAPLTFERVLHAAVVKVLQGIGNEHSARQANDVGQHDLQRQAAQGMQGAMMPIAVIWKRKLVHGGSHWQSHVHAAAAAHPAFGTGARQRLPRPAPLT